MAINAFAAEDPVPSILETAYINFGRGMDIFIQGCNQAISQLALLSVNNDIVGNATAAAGVTLTSMFFAMGVFSDLAMFRVERIEEAIKVGMKFVIAKIIIENTGAIMGGIKGMLFDTLSVSEITSAFSTLGSTIMTSLYPTATTGDLDGLLELLAGSFGLNFVINIVLIEFPVFIIIVVTMVTVILTLAGILFELGIHMAVAPIALSTLVNEMTRPTGITFIKSYAAVCLQLLIIGVVVRVYNMLVSGVGGMVTIGELLGNATEISSLGQFVEPLITLALPMILLICLTTAIKKSGDITKRMLGV
jgi:hypothetical protein